MAWRDQIAIHPAADMFPMLTGAELTDLGTDIVKNGLAQPIVFYAESLEKADWQLLDGRNRLAAMEAVGFKVDIGTIERRSRQKGCPYLAVYDRDGDCFIGDEAVRYETNADPYEFVVSVNVHRRHLTADDKRKSIAALLKANPERSNRQIAEIIKVTTDKTVGTVRRELEATAEIPQLTKTTGKDGKARSINGLRTHKPEPTSAEISARWLAQGEAWWRNGRETDRQAWLTRFSVGYGHLTPQESPCATSAKSYTPPNPGPPIPKLLAKRNEFLRAGARRNEAEIAKVEEQIERIKSPEDAKVWRKVGKTN